MKKQITFTEKDNKLIEQIFAYQKENNVPYFIEAVRQLCKTALDYNLNIKIKLK